MNILKRMSSFLLIGAVLIALPGFKRRSKPVQIPDLPAMEESADYTETKQGITLQAKRLNKSEAELILGKRAGRLWHQTRLRKTKRRKKQRICKRRKIEQIIPIQLSIKNQTDRTVTIGAPDIDLQLTDGNTVAKRLHRSSFYAAVGTVVAGVAILGALACGIELIATPFVVWYKWGGVHIAAAVASLAGAAICFTGMVFLPLATPVVATGKAVQASKENRKSRRAIKKHNFENIIHVEPDQSINTLIFVAEEDYKETFNINVQSEDNSHYVPFNVKIETSDHLLRENNDEKNDKPSD